jgi:hypothetical protein
MIETIIMAIAPSLFVGFVLAYWDRKKKKEDEEQKVHESSLVEGDMIRLDLEVATAQLSYAVAMAVKRGYANGEMEKAIERYEKAMDKFTKFERKQVAINANE